MRSKKAKILDVLGNQPIYSQSDDNLICREFENLSSHAVAFTSYLEEAKPGYRERPTERLLVCNPGERIFLAHAYYNVDSTPEPGLSSNLRCRFGSEISEVTRKRYFSRVSLVS